MMLMFGVALLVMIGMGTYLVLEQQKAADRKARALAMIGAQPIRQPGEKSKTVSARDDIAKRLRVAATTAKGAANKKSVAALLTQANVKLHIWQFWLLSVFSSAVLTGLAGVFSGNPLIVFLISVMGLLGLPRMFLKMKAGRRQKAFLNEFADALEAMARLLKAGMPVGEAIAMCAREYSGPVGEEMRRMYDAQKMGVQLSEAALEASNRMPIPEMRMLATALVIQQQTGSSLSEVLENLAGMIRARYRLKRKIIALSSEAKMSAMIIGALPLLVTLALNLVNPAYIHLLFVKGLGEMLLWGAVTWMSLGVLVMRQMINFKI